MQSFTDGSRHLDHAHNPRHKDTKFQGHKGLIALLAGYAFLGVGLLGAIVTVCCTAGCAAERTAQGAFEVAKQTAGAIIEKSHLTDTQAFAKARLNNPKYRVMAGVFNGVILEIGLEGAELEAGLQGAGSGEDIPLSPETLASLRASMSKDDFAALVALLERRKALRATPVAPVVAEPILIPASVPAVQKQ